MRRGLIAKEVKLPRVGFRATASSLVLLASNNSTRLPRARWWMDLCPVAEGRASVNKPNAATTSARE